MKRRRKLMSFGKWIATALCTALVAAWIIGGSFDFSIAKSQVSVRIGGGVLWVVYLSPNWVNALMSRPPLPRWYDLPVINNVLLTWVEVARAEHPIPPRLVELLIPLGLPTALLVGLTALLWRLDHRRPLPGHCRHCAYNLKGLTEPRCPECGEPFEAAGESR